MELDIKELHKNCVPENIEIVTIHGSVEKRGSVNSNTLRDAQKRQKRRFAPQSSDFL